MNDSNSKKKQQLTGALRDVRNRARSQSAPERELPTYSEPKSTHRLEPLPPLAKDPEGTSPDRSALNATWDISASLEAAPLGRLGRWLSPLRGPLQRLIRFALGTFVERQTEWNASQVKFDNDITAYIDHRMDRIVAHYDEVLGAHGKRMEEIDERHLILQQELIQHVHDLIKRIDFVFETAEQNHLYLEGSLREVREELQSLEERLVTSAREAALDEAKET